MIRSACCNLATFGLRFSLLMIFFATSLAADQASAQNVKKVERKLEDLVDRGHLMPRHAHAMLRTLHEMMEDEEADWEEHDDDEDLDEYRHVLEEKQEYLQKEFRRQRMETEEIVEKIKQAVESGELSPEAARKKVQLDKQKVQQVQREMTEIKGGLLELELKEAVENGDLSEEDAHLKMAALRRELKQKFNDQSKENKNDAAEGLREKREEMIAGAKKRLKIAIERGDITEQQAKERMEGLMRRFKQEDEERMNDEEKSKEAGAEEDLLKKREEMTAGVKKRLKIAIERGDITEQQAKERMEGLMRRFQQEDEERLEDEKN